MRHAHVGEYEVGPEATKEFKRIASTRGDFDLVAVLLQERRQGESDIFFVVNDEYAAHAPII